MPSPLASPIMVSPSQRSSCTRSCPIYFERATTGISAVTTTHSS
jgi:hypothetical protein